ncbi:TPA: hypothetical protein PXO86_003546 [Yersinia enterocolitica]|nr:hypothetical protein [Yersinia enterocolitica]
MTVDYKLPPHNLDAEQSVLGGLMLDDGSDNVATVELIAVTAGVSVTSINGVTLSNLKRNDWIR